MKTEHWSFGLYQGSCSVEEKNPVNKKSTYLFLKSIFTKVYSHINGLLNRTAVWLEFHNIRSKLVADDKVQPERDSPFHPAVPGIETCCRKSTEQTVAFK